MTDSQYEVLGNGILLVSLILKWLRDEWRSSKNNKKIETKVDETKQKVDETKQVVANTSQNIAQVVVRRVEEAKEETKQVLTTKVNENTDISRQAFNVANNHNEKIVNIGSQQLKIAERQVKIAERVFKLERHLSELIEDRKPLKQLTGARKLKRKRRKRHK